MTLWYAHDISSNNLNVSVTDNGELDDSRSHKLRNSNKFKIMIAKLDFQ